MLNTSAIFVTKIKHKKNVNKVTRLHKFCNQEQRKQCKVLEIKSIPLFKKLKHKQKKFTLISSSLSPFSLVTMIHATTTRTHKTLH
jgi:hypothetical protein